MEEQIQETEVVKEGLASIMPEGGNAMTSIQNATNPGLPVGNIIQQQETARGASEAQLIEYAKSPQPQIIPPYLVTAELLRRKASRERLATAPNLTVAQDAVNNAEQGLMNQMQQQQASNLPAGGYAPPREEITREQIMEKGIAPLPNPGNAVGVRNNLSPLALHGMPFLLLSNVYPFLLYPIVSRNDSSAAGLRLTCRPLASNRRRRRPTASNML